ncbi:MAG: aspartate aminotransferase family protein [Gammaproteobacteria bacterium]
MATSGERSTAEWQELDRAHYLHPFTDYRDLGRKGSRIITRAEGVYLWDSTGHKILDGMAGLWCVNVGYGREELIEAAQRQMRELPYYNSFFQCTHPPAIELSRVLTELSPPQFNHVFFTGSGSESNDTVLRLVRYYWQLRGQPGRQVIISRVNAYHGSTVAGASLGGMKPMHRQGGLPIPGIEHIEQPYFFGYRGDLSEAEFGVESARALEKKIHEIGVDNVAAFIAEPIQGAGGVIIPPDTYWPEIQRICDEYGILLVADEVICAFGRLGRWFGSERYGIRPDLMSIAKGMTSGYLPMGGVLVGDRVADIVINEGEEFFHGFTYSGHPTCCAVALANISLLKRDRLIEKVRDETGPYLSERWAALADHPLVGETRSRGLVGALELVRDKATRERFAPLGRVGTMCRDLCVENGLVMRAVGDTMIISPPLVIDKSQIDELVDLARRSLDLTAEHVL